MTPKEKAEQLVNEHYSLISGLSINFISKLITLPNGDSYYEIAKKCSLVAVDELLFVTSGLEDSAWYQNSKSY